MRELTVWKPLHDPLSWHRNMDSMFERFFGEEPLVKHPARWLPPLEAYQKDGQYFVRLDLPGVDPNNVEVAAEAGVLTIKGERKREDEEDKKGYRYHETSYGTFERRVTLPKGVEADKITARYEKGVLEIAVQVPLEVSGKKIAIDIEAN